MDGHQKFSWHSRARSFRYALNGLRRTATDEHNMRIHIAAAIAAIAAGIALDISSMEWCLVVICIAAVIAAESVNSAIEALSDKISPERDPLIEKAKDAAAGAVLITATGAALCGAIIFIPAIIALLP